MQPLVTSQPSLVHTLPSSQAKAAPGWQLPPPQTSTVVQALLSVQGKVLFWCVQPVLASHSSVVHGLPSSHGACVPPTHSPPEHASFSVHELPSSHASVLGVNTQPLAMLQLSSVHGLPSVHARIAPGLQAPPAHVSLVVQTLPSVQAAVLLLWVQPATVSHASSVQILPSAQLGEPEPPLQSPPLRAYRALL